MPISSSVFSRKGDREHNDITSPEFQAIESRYQKMCRDADMRYNAPNMGRTNKELKADTKRRRSNMTRMCDLYSDVNSEKFKATEEKHRKKCADAGVPYMAPDIDRDATIENKRDTTRRRAAMTRSCTQHNNINTMKMSAKFTQIPVNSSDAITGHKLQGLTKDSLVVYEWDSDTCWIYVVLSRVRTLKGLYLIRPIRRSDIKPASREYLDFMVRMETLANLEVERFRAFHRRMN